MSNQAFAPHFNCLRCAAAAARQGKAAEGTAVNANKPQRLNDKTLDLYITKYITNILSLYFNILRYFYSSCNRNFKQKLPVVWGVFKREACCHWGPKKDIARWQI